MSWSKRFKLIGFLVIAAAMPVLAACTMTPVYSGRLAEPGAIALAYGEPGSRLDQIIYQELALRFGESTSPDADLVTVSTSAGAARLVDTVSANPNTAYEVTVIATLTLAPQGDPDAKPMVLVRRASAGFQQGAQILNDQSAYIEASERAAKSAAESLRLAILATLTR